MASHRTILLLAVISFLSIFSQAVRNLQIVSPLQSLTIWDPETKEEASQVGPTPRRRFLFKFQAGLSAEKETKQYLEDRRKELVEKSVDGSGQTAVAGWQDPRIQDNLMEQAYDQAASLVEGEIERRRAIQKQRRRNANKYQFVGVVQRPTDPTSVQWYARPKPAGAKWSLRLVHVNREAVVKDLFDRRQADIFAKYKNTGELDAKTQQPIVSCQYTVRERSWKNLWNFSPKNFFTDSSGMYWRERRLQPGLYTDGNTVFESSYRYDDGRNGMHRLSSFDEYLNSPSVDKTQKQTILQRLKTDDPDVVLE